jgi:DNA-directed RNA polymerase specialized sigma24 family protein
MIFSTDQGRYPSCIARVAKYALKLTRRVIDAENLIQDTWTHACAKRARYLDHARQGQWNELKTASINL